MYSRHRAGVVMLCGARQVQCYYTPPPQDTLGSYQTQLQANAFQSQQFAISALLRMSLKGGPSLGLLDGPSLARTVGHIFSQHPRSLWSCCWRVVRVLGSSTPPHPLPHAHSRHSGIMHFSAWDVSALHMEPSAGLILTMRCRFFMPIPQVALHSSHSPHSVIRQLLGAGRPALLESCLRPLPAPPSPALAGRPYSQHSSLTMHFSVSSVGSVHTEPSSGNCFTYLSRDRMPMPQEMLQGDQVIHSDMVQVEPSATHEQTLWPVCPTAQGRD